jgi:arginase family enzyme
MKDLSIYFQSIESGSYSEGDLGAFIQSNNNSFPEIESKGVALFYVPEHRGLGLQNGKVEALNFRKFLYDLKTHNCNVPIYDLGDLHPGQTVEDTYFAVANVVEELVKNDVLPIIIGGGQDLTFAQYKAYERLEQTINITAIDPKFDLGSPDGDLTTDDYLSQIISHKPCYLFNYSNIGYQTYLIKEEQRSLFQKMYFDLHRLGEVNADMTVSEPILRNTDLLSFDMTSIRNSDFQKNYHRLPNGFYGEQACQLARYAGISDKLTSVGFYNYLPQNDADGAAAHLLAQIIWFFIDGVNHRKGDFPIGTKKSYTKYIVTASDFQDAISFYKSDKSGRWWMEVPYPSNKSTKYNRHHLVPCNYSDYEKAMTDELPDLWWQTYQKLT